MNLKPWERFLVGSHVLQNGPRRSQIRVQDGGAGVLRLSDALHPEQVTTPLTRAYYAAQLLLLGEEDGEAASASLLEVTLVQLRDALGASEGIDEALRHAEGGRYFAVLRALRPLLPEEALLLSGACQGGQDNFGEHVSAAC
nr:flagellar biosynthesis repressor FlbT [Parvularcula mediterranea]